METPNKLENHGSTSNRSTRTPGYLTCEPEELPDKAREAVARHIINGRRLGLSDKDFEDAASLCVIEFLEARQRRDEDDKPEAVSTLARHALSTLYSESVLPVSGLPRVHLERAVILSEDMRRLIFPRDGESSLPYLPGKLKVEFKVPDRTKGEALDSFFIDRKNYYGMLMSIINRYETLDDFDAQESTLLDGSLVPIATTEEDYEERERNKRLEEAIGTILDDREAGIIRLRFGIDTEDGEIKTVKEVAEAMGIAVERVRQIENKALAKLRHTLNPEDYV